MGMLSRKLRNLEGGKVGYWCQGCDMLHAVRVYNEGSGPQWKWNADHERPTFEPSVLVRFPRMSEAGRARVQAFKDEHGRLPTTQEIPFDQEHVCHTFITEGRVNFLGDCTHHCAGQLLDLPDLPDFWQE